MLDSQPPGRRVGVVHQKDHRGVVFRGELPALGRGLWAHQHHLSAVGLDLAVAGGHLLDLHAAEGAPGAAIEQHDRGRPLPRRRTDRRPIEVGELEFGQDRARPEGVARGPAVAGVPHHIHDEQYQRRQREHRGTPTLDHADRGAGPGQQQRGPRRGAPPPLTRNDREEHEDAGACEDRPPPPCDGADGEERQVGDHQRDHEDPLQLGLPVVTQSGGHGPTRRRRAPTPRRRATPIRCDGHRAAGSRSAALRG